MGILAAIAIPFFLAQREKANLAACKSDTRNAAEAANLYGVENNGDYTGMQTDPDLLANGFNQTQDPVITTVVDTADPNGFTLHSNCPTPPGSTTSFDSDEGVVTVP
jgi:type IV pilus assembly protein PilA